MSHTHEDVPNRLLLLLTWVFNEATMGVVAILAIGIAIYPMCFSTPSELQWWLTFVEWILVGSFVVDLLLRAGLAADRRQWLLDWKWRALDFVTIVGPLVALLPHVSNWAAGPVIFRLARVGRAAALAAKASSAVITPAKLAPRDTLSLEPLVILGDASGKAAPEPADWKRFLKCLDDPGEVRARASCLDTGHFREFALKAGFSAGELDRLLFPDAHAALRAHGAFPALLLRIPTVPDTGFPAVHREWLLAVFTDLGVMSATTGIADLHQAIVFEDAAQQAVAPQASVVAALFTHVNGRNRVVVRRFEAELKSLALLEADAQFLRETFQLKQEISNAALDLWHLREIVRGLADGKTSLGLVPLKDDKALDDILAETESLHQTVTQIKEELHTLIELHINFKSFEMNKLLRLLSVITFLGFIPSIAVGVLGMSVAGLPTQAFSVAQVLFVLAFAVAIPLYLVIVKGAMK